MAERATALDQTAAHYLHDVALLIKEKARHAKKEKDASAGSEDYDFKLGRLIALQEVVSLLQEQAKSFGIPPEQVGLDDVDPYEDLR